MSHYTVMVQIPKTRIQDYEDYIAEVFERYDENRRVPLHPNITREECSERYIREVGIRKKRIAEVTKRLKTGKLNTADKNLLADERRRLKLLEDGGVSAEWGRQTRYHEEPFNEKGEPLTTYNPESRWDWYVIGGRWSGRLLAKGSQIPRDFVHKKDIDFEAMVREWEVGKAERVAGLRELYKTYTNEKEKWESAELKQERLADVQKMIDEAEAETFCFTAAAVVTKNGGWHQPAKMGWFGCTYDRTEDQNTWDEKFRERFLDPLDDSDAVVIVDCHI